MLWELFFKVGVYNNWALAERNGYMTKKNGKTTLIFCLAQQATWAQRIYYFVDIIV